jgi:hypothetical protein
MKEDDAPMKRVDESSVAIILVVAVVGLAIRLAIPLTSAFPLNDGGLFYAMITDLEANHFVLPALTTYNSASIPFAYPPLAFFLYGAVNTVTHIPLLLLMRLGPALVSTGSLVAFYALARDLLSSKVQAALAALVFMLLPRAFAWLIMGGGVTRSLGMLFALLAMRQAFRLFTKPSVRTILGMIVLGSLVVYTHPEAATHTVISTMVFFFWKSRSLRGVAAASIVAATVAALSAPWWATVLARYGWDPFLAARAAAQADSYNALEGLLVLFRFDFADEPHVALLTAFSLIGIILQLSARKFAIPGWLLAMHAIEPRGGALFIMIPLALSAGIGLEGAILPAFATLGLNERAIGPTPRSAGNWLESVFASPATRLFLGFVFVYGIMSAYETAWKVGTNLSLSPPDLRALEWVRANTPQGSRFAVVTIDLPLRDATSEWFPALTGRQSLATVFGYEWVRKVDFGKKVEEYQSLQECSPFGPACLDTWSVNYAAPFDYVYIRNAASVHNVALTGALAASADYEGVYNSPTVEIFARK